jgi:hypothetical protein
MKSIRKPLAAILAALVIPACNGSIEALRERDAEHVFLRGVTYLYEEKFDLPSRIGDFVTILEGKRVSLTGVGIVVDLDGTGDKGEAFEKAKAFLDSQPGLRAPPEVLLDPGKVALVSVETRISPALGAAAGLVGAVARPLGNAESLEGGMLLETSLVEAGTREVRAIAAGPLLTARVDRDGNPIRTPKFGRIMKIEVKEASRAAVTMELEFDPVWPEILDAASSAVRAAYPTLGVKAEPPSRMKIELPSDPLERTPDTASKILSLAISPGSAGICRLLCSRKDRAFLAVGGRLYFGRGTFLLGEGVRVVSMAPPGRMLKPSPRDGVGEESDLAMVEVTRNGKKRKIVTLRWARQVVRVLDRLGVEYDEILRLMKMASDSGVLNAVVVEMGDGLEKFLKEREKGVR